MGTQLEHPDAVEHRIYEIQRECADSEPRPIDENRLCVRRFAVDEDEVRGPTIVVNDGSWRCLDAFDERFALVTQPNQPRIAMCAHDRGRPCGQLAPTQPGLIG